MAGHSKGQPKTNIKNIITTSFQMSGSGIATSVLVITVAVPSLVKTAPNTFEETASNRTMLDVTMVATAAFLSAANVRPRTRNANIVAPKAPHDAASVGVARPASMVPSVKPISSASGSTPIKTSLMTSQTSATRSSFGTGGPRAGFQKLRTMQ